MRTHADRLARLEEAGRIATIAPMTPAERQARIACLYAKAGITDAPAARTAFLATLRLKHQKDPVR